MADYIDGAVFPTSAKLKRDKYSEADLARLRKLAEEGAYDPEAVADAVFFPVIASANTVDSYGTFMLPSTLSNFAADATAGVAVLDSHNSRRLNFGMSVSGEYVEQGKARYMRSDFYTIPNLQTEGLDTNTYIKGVQAGLFRDVSVGFWMPPGSEVRCTICDKDMMRWYMDDGCSHFPGMEYEVESGGEKRKVTAFGAVDGGRLSEYSFVHDGATPGAGVLKARHMEDNGELNPEIALRLERAYHTTFPRATRKYQGITLAGDRDMGTNTKRKQDEPVSDDQVVEDVNEVEVPDNDELINPDVGTEPTIIEPVFPEVEERDDEGEIAPDPEDDDTGDRAIEKSALRFNKNLRDALNERYNADGIRIGERVSDAVIALADEVKSLRTALVEKDKSVRALEDDAKVGRVYRADLIEELKREIIRSADADESKEAKVARYVKLAEASDVETIKGLRDDFANAARAKYGAGRRTIDGEESTVNGKKPAKVPVTVYDDL